MANGKANKEKKQKKDSKRNERATPAAGSTPGKTDGGPLHRGLIVHNKFVDLILAETKTLEIRNQFLRCVPEGGEFYLLRAFEKGAGRNLHGQTCLEIAAKLIFKGNHFISHDDFDSFYDKHRVPSNAYASMRKGWKSDKGGCVAWEIEVDSVINPPRYLPSGSQEVWYNFTWDSTFEHKDDVPLKTRTKRQNDGMKQTSISDSLVKGGHEQAQPDANPDAPATVAGTEAAPAKIKKEHVLEPRPRVQGTTTEKSTSISSSSKRCPSPVKGPHPAHVEGESERRSLPGDQLLTHQGVLNATRLDEEKCLFPPESSEKTTKSLMHALDFYDSFLDEVVARTEKGDGHRRNHAAAGLDHATCTLDQLADWLETTSHSSAFSGIASPETALMGLYRAVQRRLPSRQIDMPRLTSFVEWDSECQQELMTLCKGLDQDSCIFSDIAGFFRDDIADLIKGLEQKPTMAFEILAPLLCSRKAMKRRAWCLRHQKECFLQTSDAHAAGSSCTAHSKQGLGKAFSDKNAIHFLAWCGLRLEVGEKEITLENVEEFPTDALERLMSPMYFIEAIKMDPRFFGFPIARGRKYHRLRNKAAALMELSPFSRFNKRFFRLVHWSWREFAFMHMFKDGVIPTEFEAELQWARSRKLSMIRTFANSGHESVEDIDRIVAHYGAQEVSDAKDMICALGGFQEQPFLASLNANELKMRGLYAEKAPGEAWQLNQNPGAVHGMHSTLFWMHTLIHNCGLIWVDEVHQPEPHETSAKADFPGCERACSRWLFGTECLCLQGFPVHPDFSDFFTSSFHFERQRKPRSICAQAGNSMHVVCPFLCHLHSAVCWRQPGEYNRIIGEIALFREAALLKRKQISSKSACVPDKEKGADGKRPKKRVKGKQPDPPQRI